MAIDARVRDVVLVTRARGNAGLQLPNNRRRGVCGSWVWDGETEPVNAVQAKGGASG